MTRAGREKWKRSGWREGEGKWQKSWVREAGGGKPKKEKSRCRKDQGKNEKFHNQSAVRTCCDGYFRTAMLIQQLFIDKYCF